MHSFFQFFVHSFYYKKYFYEVPQPEEEVVKTIRKLFEPHRRLLYLGAIRGHFTGSNSFFITRTALFDIQSERGSFGAVLTGEFLRTDYNTTRIEIKVRPTFFFAAFFIGAVMLVISFFIKLLLAENSMPYLVKLAIVLVVIVPTILLLARNNANLIRKEFEFRMGLTD